MRQIWKINETMTLYEEKKSGNRNKLRHILGKTKNEKSSSWNKLFILGRLTMLL